MRETVYESVLIVNKTEMTQTINTAKISVASSADSKASSHVSSRLSVISSSESSSSVSSIIDYLVKEDKRARERAHITTMGTTTTTLNYDYTSYRIKIPTKFKYCNPLERLAPDGTLIPADSCITINVSCCPCASDQIVDGKLKKYGWGGKVDAINAKNYRNDNNSQGTYYSDYLKNCTGFGVVCRMGSSPSGCYQTAACQGGICKIVGRY